QLLAGQRAETRGGTRRFLFANRAAHFVETNREKFLRIERRFSRQHFVEKNAERVDVAAGVNVQTGQDRLLGTHVGRRADELLEGGEDGFVRELQAAGGLG